jgi:PilZ domain-containing protein
MRASRFPLHLLVLYRRVGEPDWRQGKTENISRSGVLFRAEELVLPDTDVELRLALPAAAPGREPPEVSCRGRVVRTVSPSEHEPLPGSAVVIEHYDFLPPPLDSQSLSSL